MVEDDAFDVVEDDVFDVDVEAELFAGLDAAGVSPQPTNAIALKRAAKGNNFLTFKAKCVSNVKVYNKKARPK